MTKEIDDLREYLRNYLGGHSSVDKVTPKSGNSDEVHLAVYRTRNGKPIGVEFDKETLQIIWVRAADTITVASPDVKVTKKNWNGIEWKSADDKGANSNLGGYEDFVGHDLVRFGVKSKNAAHEILDQLFEGRTTRRYFLKVNGELHCPKSICRPAASSDWDGGEVLIPDSGPIYAVEGSRPNAPEIQQGDELWIWTHEDDEFGRGWGLTAKATAGPQRKQDNFIAITLRDVERLPRPFGLRDLGDGETGSRLLNHTRAHRHHQAYLIEDDDYADFRKVVDAKSHELPEDIRQSYAQGWEREVLTHKDDLLAGLQDRKTSTQKARSGQAQFRDALMKRYMGRCVITRCAISEALEAAHIMPHTGDPKWDHPDNGMLLRRDLHSLFDAMLWSIDPKNNRMRMAERLKTTTYGKLDGREIDHQVAPALLEVHFRQFKKGNV
ncbi:HNH endonuclease [Litoreibacter arenae]|uniref:HNH nuclease domain-containing protein n=1 Tax=Litoreibacter arenae DSM 19593 TaxID=1123360 RepID=S9QI78_9RHOB|nr:HNH endonuclease signature motif containing protein [Litoreibacter arenae]EPX81146.1 hypothetical protein thalar_00595 [Litoreibacter arenae DSM 19593]